jgi:hypothetical protein
MHTALLINHPRVVHLFVFVIIRYRLWFGSWELMRARLRTWAICCTSAMVRFVNVDIVAGSMLPIN